MANRVIFNENATTILWSDGTKTTVKAYGEDIDHEKGLAMAVAKRVFMDADGHWKNKFNKVLKDAERDELKRVSFIVVEKLKKIYNAYYDEHAAKYLNRFDADTQKDICNRALKHTIRNRKKYIPTNTGLKSSDIEAYVQKCMEEYFARFITQHPIAKNAKYDKFKRVAEDIVKNLEVLYNDYYDSHIARYLDYYNKNDKQDVQKDVCNSALNYAMQRRWNCIPNNTGFKFSDIESEVVRRMEAYSDNFIADHPIK